MDKAERERRWGISPAKDERLRARDDGRDGKMGDEHLRAISGTEVRGDKKPCSAAGFFNGENIIERRQEMRTTMKKNLQEADDHEKKYARFMVYYL
jgi:hypothetical protein